MTKRPANFEEKLALYEEKIDRDVREWRRSGVLNDLEEMAAGGDGGSTSGGGTVRSHFFPGWRNEDFEVLARDLAHHEHEVYSEKFLWEAEQTARELVSQAKMHDVDVRELRDALLRGLGER